MKIFAINSFANNEFAKSRLQTSSFQLGQKEPRDTFVSFCGDNSQKSDLGKEFSTLSKMAHAGQAGSAWELFKQAPYNNLETLRRMLTMQDKDKRTPLHKAVRGAGLEAALKNYKQGELEEIFGNYNDKKIKDNLKEVSAIRKNAKQPIDYLATIWIMLAPFENDPNALKEILTVRDYQGQTPLTEAANGGAVDIQTMLHWFEKHPETLKEVLLDKDKFDQQTLLHILAQHREQPKVISGLFKPFENDPKTLKGLLAAQDWRGNTPLHLAIKSAKEENILALFKPFINDPEAIRELLLTKNKNGKTPFDFAASFDFEDRVSEIIFSYVNLVGKANKEQS